MKNIFGTPKQKNKTIFRAKEHILKLEKHIKKLENKLEQLNQQQKTTIKETKITDHNNKKERFFLEKTTNTAETETVFPEEEDVDFHEKEYLILEQPKLQRNKALELLKKEAIKNIYTNRREIIKKKIEEELKRKELSAKELKILFVNEHRYCSKATFYRYLELLRKEQRIDSIKINGKEYLCSIPSTNNFNE